MSISCYRLLPRSFYAQDTAVVAQQLLGCFLVRIIRGKILVGKIVETEAYHIHDPACHAYHGKTAANQALFGPVGHAYIYFIYGMYYCLNAVAHMPHIQAGGVLIRAVEPLEGISYMQKMRGIQSKNLTNGPGKLAQAFAVDKKLYGTDLTKKGPLSIVAGESVAQDSIVSSPRIGISKAQELHWRFYIKNSPWVSR